MLPNVERIPLETLRQLNAFARQGGIVIALRRKPALLPGRITSGADKAELNSLLQRLFAGEKPSAHFIPEDKDLGEALASLTRPDVTLPPAAPGIGFLHRHTHVVGIHPHHAPIPQSPRSISARTGESPSDNRPATCRSCNPGPRMVQPVFIRERQPMKKK